MDELLLRLDLLGRLIKKGTDTLPWCGNLAIQKLVYLLQSVFEVDLAYVYGLHHLGPYSPELAQHLGLGEQVGLWESWEEALSGPGGRPITGRRFSVRPDALPRELSTEGRARWATLEARVEMALSRLNSLRGRELELIATLHYLTHVQQVAPDELQAVLKLLKPKFGPTDFTWGQRKLMEIQEPSAAA